MSDVGFIGLGKMGLPILKAIMEKFEVKAVYNRTKYKAEGLKGVKIADDPFSVASSCNIIFTIVSDDRACDNVFFGDKGIERTIRPQSLVVNMSTVSPEFSLYAARKFQDLHCTYLEAPVLGSTELAGQKKLVSLVSGPENAYRTVEKVIDTYSEKVFYMPTPGNAIKMKLIANLVMAVNLAAAGEGLLMAEKAGIGKELALDIIGNSGAESRIVTFKSETIKAGTYEPEFLLKDMVKDLSYASDLSRSISSPIPIGANAIQYYIAAMSIGLGNLDFASVVRSFRFLIGSS